MEKTNAFVFKHAGGKAMKTAEVAERYGVPLLGQFPLTDGVRAGCDDGMPAVAAGSDSDKARFRALVDAVLARPEVQARLAVTEGAR